MSVLFLTRGVLVLLRFPVPFWMFEPPFSAKSGLLKSTATPVGRVASELWN